MAKKRKAKTRAPARTAQQVGVKWLTRPELAAALGVTTWTITRWEKDGMPVAKRAPRGKPSQFDLAAVEAWKLTADATGETASFSLAKSRAIESDRRAEKLEMEIALRRGDLVQRDQVRREGQALVRALTAKLRSLPRRAEHAGVIGAAQVDGLAAFCRELLEEIAGWKTVADLPVEAKTA